MSSRRDQLYALTLEFLDAFNCNDLDAVRAFFTDGSLYDELNRRPNEGRAVTGTPRYEAQA